LRYDQSRGPHFGYRRWRTTLVYSREHLALLWSGSSLLEQMGTPVNCLHTSAIAHALANICTHANSRTKKKTQHPVNSNRSRCVGPMSLRHSFTAFGFDMTRA
jgi:hypothetical protein